MPALRHASIENGTRNREAGPTTGLPKLEPLIPVWHEQAKCAEETDENLYFAEPTAVTINVSLESPAYLLTTLLCARCPVRRPCLEAAFEGISFPGIVRETPSGRQKVDVPRHSRLMGSWGGSVEAERNALHDLPVADAVEALESTLQRRIDARTAAWLKLVARRPLTPTGKPILNWRERRIVALLGLENKDLGGVPYASPPAPRPTSHPKGTCRACGTDLAGRHGLTRYCSAECKQAWSRRVAA